MARHTSPAGERELAPAAARPRRLVSLDVFRGLTMAGMVIVNNPGDWNTVYWPLLHAEWNGWTPTDVIFPFFLFIVGVSMTLSRRPLTWGRIVQRAVTIAGLGWFMGGFPFFHLATWRIPGVLVRIGLCYFCAAAISRVARPASGSDRRHLVRVAATATLLIVGYWLLMTQVQTPWAARGDLSPEGNLGAVLDRALFTGHLYHGTWDPEGLLSSVPAVGTTLLGIAVGLWIRLGPDQGLGLVGAGCAATALGLLWGRSFPINKNLWTSSYVVFTAGFGTAILGVLRTLLDRPVHGSAGERFLQRLAHPFVILGENAIALFVVSGLVGKLLIIVHASGPTGESLPLQAIIYQRYFLPLASPFSASLLYAVTCLALLFGLLRFLYGRHILLKV